MATVLTDILNSSNAYHYMIITMAAHNSDMDWLISAKEQRGLDVCIANPDSTAWTDIYPPPLDYTQIKGFLSYAYDNWATPPTYVLLVGDIDVIPWTTLTSSEPGDYWYSDVNSDYVPDYQLGRIPFNSSGDIQDYCEMAAKHESKLTGAWTKQILLTAYEDGTPSSNNYVKCKNDIYAPTVAAGYLVQKGYAEGNGWPGSQGQCMSLSEIKNAIEAGVAVLNYRGHGMEEYWAGSWKDNGSTDHIYKSTVDGYSISGEKYPAVFAICCRSCWLDYASGRTIGERWLLKSPYVIGATRDSWTEPNHLFDRELLKAITESHDYRAGDIYKRATAMCKMEGKTSNIRIYMALGDPDVLIVGEAQIPEPPPEPPEPPPPTPTQDAGIIFARAIDGEYMEWDRMHGNSRVESAKGMGIPVHDIPEHEVNWDSLKLAVEQNTFNTFIHADHGRSTTQWGDDTLSPDWVITSNSEESMDAMVGKAVYSFSCLTSAILGPTMIDRGTRSYAGYTGLYWFCYDDDPAVAGSMADTYYVSTNAPGWQFVESLIALKTWQEAFDETLTKFDTEIEYWMSGPGQGEEGAEDCIWCLEIDKPLLDILGDLAFKIVGAPIVPPPPEPPGPPTPAEASKEHSFDMQAVRCFRHVRSGD